MKLRVTAAAAAIIHVLCAPSYCAVQVSGVFGDHMVLQRDVPVKVWGRADAGEKVEVKLGRNSASATAGGDGAWAVSLPAMTAGGPYEMTVKGANTVTFGDILIGDVWLCSGQSNMGTGLARREPPLDPGETDLPKVRYLGIPNAVSVKPLADAPALRWLVSSKDTVINYPAAPWFFGQMLHQETGIPIGIIKANWGGAVPENWMSAESMKAVPELDGLYRDYENKLKIYEENLPRNTQLLTDWVKAAGEASAKGQDIPPVPIVDLHPVYAPPYKTGFFCMYNGMISYLTRFPIKGVTWYQGESSGDDGPIYYHKMLALIQGWRQAWNQPDLPFYFVQLPNHGGACGVPEAAPKGWPLLREVQARCLSIPNTGMAVTIDIGDEDLHPRNKYDTGRRLAAIALAKNYGRNIEYTGPVYRGAEIKGSRVIISFDSVGAGLMVGRKEGTSPTVEDREGRLQEFAIASADRRFHPADAVIEGNTVVVSSPAVEAPVSVRYAYTYNPAKRNLYGRNGLPAGPFRTDNW